MRCGELCKSCVGRCREIVSEIHPADIECPCCGGDGCGECDDGFFAVAECPSKYIGQALIADLHIIAASETHLPVSGGLLDQSAWWFELRNAMRCEENIIQDEQQKRRFR